jgi:methanogenic corrinoid protein MtbC1
MQSSPTSASLTEARRATMPASGPGLSRPALNDLAQQVILRLARRTQTRPRRGALDAVALTEALLRADDDAVMALVENHLGHQDGLKPLYLNLLSAVAIDLGQRWDRDELHSSDVIIATGRIFALMRRLSGRILPEDITGTRHVVLATVPGEQHSLGLAMAADLLRQDGWLVDLKSGRTLRELIDELARTDLTLLGLSASTLAQVAPLTALVEDLRETAPHVRILLAGRLAAICPDLPSRCGVDAAAADFDGARAALEVLNGSVRPERAVWA